jgi:glutamyl-tRNA reductase
MVGTLLGIGVSHKTASLALRERLGLSERRASDVLARLCADEGIGEAVALSTCNRTELYLVADDPDGGERAAATALAGAAEMRPADVSGALRTLRGPDVARHLFRVTAGLESMIVGEAEVQGQVRRAYELALAQGTAGPVTSRLFRDALHSGKRVRNVTGVSRSRVSVATVAVELARRELGDLADRRVLVIGAGRHGELTARALAEHGARAVFVANRRYQGAVVLARRFGGSAVRFDDLLWELKRSDIVLSCTSCPHRILGRRELGAVAKERGGDALVLIDTAIPRDVDPVVRDLPGVRLFDLDDLQRAVAENLAGREQEALRADPVIDDEVARFERWLKILEVVPTISALRERGRVAIERALTQNATRWEALTEQDRERVELVAGAVVSHLLHEPTLRLKRAATGQGSEMYVETLRELFDLEPRVSGRNGARPELRAHRRVSAHATR